MKQHISFRQYRWIDLTILLAVLAVSQYLIHHACTFWYPEQLYVVSPVAAVTTLVMMRWNGYAAIHALCGGLLFVALAEGEGRQYLVYGLGNLACLGALLAIALVGSFRLVQTRTEWLPQPVTLLTPSELTAREEMTARTAGTSGVYLYGLTVADGAENYRVQMELWTDEGLAQTWMVAEEDNLTDVPRHQQVAFSYSADRARSSMKIGMTLAVSTSQTTLEGIPALDLGYLLSILNEQCEADPEHGVVLACWSLAAENGVTLEPDGGRTIIWSTPGWTGTVEKPRVLEGERFLLLRLLVQ